MKMKKIVSIALLSLICSFSYAQTESKTTSVVQEENFVSNKVKGEFNFEMPEGTSAAKINETAKYYTEYFRVQYDTKTRIARVFDVQENMQGVILRFLISNDIDTISYNGKEYGVEKFVANFVQ